jgi:uncharacterized membrane protein YdbT with pleckstrin-like domain
VEEGVLKKKTQQISKRQIQRVDLEDERKKI